MKRQIFLVSREAVDLKTQQLRGKVEFEKSFDNASVEDRHNPNLARVVIFDGKINKILKQDKFGGVIHSPDEKTRAWLRAEENILKKQIETIISNAELARRQMIGELM